MLQRIPGQSKAPSTRHGTMQNPTGMTMASRKRSDHDGAALVEAYTILLVQLDLFAWKIHVSICISHVQLMSLSQP